jgi:TolB protein
MNRDFSGFRKLVNRILTMPAALIAVVWFVLMWTSGPARAALEIQIIGGAANKIPVAIQPFGMQGALPQPAQTEIIGSDLQRSGEIALVSTQGAPVLSDGNLPDWGLWAGRGADALVTGQARVLPGGQVEVRFRLFDVVKKTQLTGFNYTVSAAQWRAVAHKIADIIYEKLTGTPGVFSTRIAYIHKQGKIYELRVADADGFDPRTVVRSGEPLISPAFSPDGDRIAYVSFEKKKPVVYVQSLVNGARKPVAAFKGSNSAPAWAPDGKSLAVTLTRDNNSQIYRLDLSSGNVTRLTRSSGIDTEPVFSPDGQTLYFTSDRGGSPQIYRMPASGGEARRVTFNGSYNVSPTISPDGKMLAYVAREDGRFRITTLDLASGQTQTLTDTSLDESPSFAPNGRIILYATALGGRGVLGTVTLDGRTRAQLSERGVNAREPSWGP